VRARGKGTRPKKLIELVNEINELLDAKQKRLAGNPSPENLSSIQKVGALVNSTVSTIRTDARDLFWNLRFRRQIEPEHRRIGNLGMLKSVATFHAFKNPSGHLPPRTGDSQKAGEHLCTLPYQHLVETENRVFPVVPGSPGVC
jgi:hypothetical protein